MFCLRFRVSEGTFLRLSSIVRFLRVLTSVSVTMGNSLAPKISPILGGSPHAGVIFFRLPGATLQTKIEHLDMVLDEHTEELKRGEFLVVTPGQIRVAGRPHSWSPFHRSGSRGGVIVHALSDTTNRLRWGQIFYGR